MKTHLLPTYYLRFDWSDWIVLIKSEILIAKEMDRSLRHISEPTRRTPISYAVFCLKTILFTAAHTYVTQIWQSPRREDVILPA